MNLDNFSAPMLVVAVALTGADGRILMQQRHFAAEHGGLWEFPGGKVEPGEAPEHAAARELAEELGVAIDPADLHPVGFASGESTGKSGAPRSLVILLYACAEWQGTPQALDAEAIASHASGSISGLQMPPLDYPLAEALCSFLARQAI
jgi:8-oxo-dGTP diphosphatase